LFCFVLFFRSECGSRDVKLDRAPGKLPKGVKSQQVFILTYISRLKESRKSQNSRFPETDIQVTNDNQTTHASLYSIFKGEQKLVVYWSSKIDLKKNLATSHASSKVEPKFLTFVFRNASQSSPSASFFLFGFFLLRFWFSTLASYYLGWLS